MAVQLEVSDGSPWWLSDDIWTVPSAPDGLPGTPVVGQPCYLWARVQNDGATRVENAQVRFYWANPSVGFDRTTATLVGSSNVTLDPSTSSDVLCLAPWVPTFVNNGHECVLAEAFHQQLDPLPATNAFDVPTDRHVAQRNLDVIVAIGKFHLAFEVHNPNRIEAQFRLVTRKGDHKEFLRATKRYPHLYKILQQHQPGVVHEPGFVQGPCPDLEAGWEGRKDKEEVKLWPAQRTGLSVVGKLEGAYALLHVEQQAIYQGRKATVGGLSLLVINTAVHNA